MSRPENEFPTIRDLRDGLSRFIDGGLGDLPVQVVIVPPSTMEAIARDTQRSDYETKRPALLIELDSPSATRIPVMLLSAAYLTGRPKGMQ